MTKEFGIDISDEHTNVYIEGERLIYKEIGTLLHHKGKKSGLRYFYAERMSGNKFACMRCCFCKDEGACVDYDNVLVCKGCYDKNKRLS